MKITAKTQTGISESLSNFMPGCREGYEAAKKEFMRVVEKAAGDPEDINAEAISKALNAHRWTTATFKPYRPLVNGVSIQATDWLGNKSIIKVTA